MCGGFWKNLHKIVSQTIHQLEKRILEHHPAGGKERGKHEETKGLRHEKKLKLAESAGTKPTIAEELMKLAVKGRMTPAMQAFLQKDLHVLKKMSSLDFVRPRSKPLTTCRSLACSSFRT